MELLVSDLEALVQAGELLPLAGQFFMLFFGALLATLIAWGTAGDTSDRAFAVFIASGISLGGLALASGALWWSERRSRLAIRRRVLPLST